MTDPTDIERATLERTLQDDALRLLATGKHTFCRLEEYRPHLLIAGLAVELLRLREENAAYRKDSSRLASQVGEMLSENDQLRERLRQLTRKE